MYITVIYINYDRSIIFLTILKLFKISGLQTKWPSKKDLSIKKMKKITLLK
jgi:hypothetical protein